MFIRGMNTFARLCMHSTPKKVMSDTGRQNKLVKRNACKNETFLGMHETKKNLSSYPFLMLFTALALLKCKQLIIKKAVTLIQIHFNNH